MLDKVGRKFNMKYWKKAPVFSLHDCLITTEGFEGNLEAILKEVFVDVFNVAPKVETAYW